VGLYYRTLGKEIEIEESGETRKKKSSENKMVIPGCVKKKKKKKKSSMSIFDGVWPSLFGGFFESGAYPL